MTNINRLSEGFPNLNSSNHSIESPPTTSYNCIAWAAGDNSSWWWPNEDYFWPSGVPLEETPDAFIQAYKTLGYEVCEDGTLENGFEKIVIYGHSGSIIKPTHAARQLPNGKWASKLGADVDIYHNEPSSVSGLFYGSPIIFMKRPRA